MLGKAMNVMYISYRFETNICATMHFKALEEVIGAQNIFTIDLRTTRSYAKSSNSVSFGYVSLIEKVQRVLQTTTWYLTKKRIHQICDLVNEMNIDVVFIDESILGQLVRSIKSECPSVKVITFYHDIARKLYFEWLKNSGPRFLLECIAGVYGEYLSQRYSDVSLVLNKRDQKLFERYYSKSPSGLLQMAVSEPDLNDMNAKEFRFDKIDHLCKNILFVGTLYKPNLTGLDWFVNNVFIKLQKNYNLVVVGRGLERLEQKYSNISNMYLVGGVESLAPYYNNADVVIAPLFSGGGMKQKTAEAFAYGRSFIGTVESLQGYETELELYNDNRRIVFKADTAEEQLEAFQYLEEVDGYGFSEELHRRYNEKYSLNALIDTLYYWLNNMGGEI